MPKKKSKLTFDSITDNTIKWIGSTSSVIVHTLFFAGVFTLRLFGASVDDVLLILTTLVSLEAIYLAIFIQRTVNRQQEDIEDIEQDIGEIDKALDEAEADRDKTVDETAKKTALVLEQPLDEIVEEIRQDVKELLEKQRSRKSNWDKKIVRA